MQKHAQAPSQPLWQAEREKTPADQPMQRKENRTGLPDNLKAGIENLSGMDMGDTKVHYNSDRPAGMQAHAYAQGTDIHVAPGQEKHLPHEAWHVVQQKQGRVKPTRQLKGKTPVNDDAGLEKEADVMGSRALSAPAKDMPVSPPVAPVQSKAWAVAQLRVATDANDWNSALAARVLLAQQNQTRINGIIDDGVTRQKTPVRKGGIADFDTLLHNTCESIRGGKVNVGALTHTLSCDVSPVGYTEGYLGSFVKNRVPLAAQQRNLFFDSLVIYPAVSVPSQTAAAGLAVDPTRNFVRQGDEPAHSDDHEVRIFMDAGHPYSDDIIRNILVHEGQHSLDKHAAGNHSFADASLTDSRNTAGVGDVANRYKTEFRAYWLAGNPGNDAFAQADQPAQNTRRVGPTWRSNGTATNFRNRRQEQIFWKLAAGGYPWVVTNYTDSQAFRDMVDQYDRPVGGNLINSERIETFFRRMGLIRIDFGRIPQNPDAARQKTAMKTLRISRDKLLKNVAILDADDHVFLSDLRQSAPFWRNIDSLFFTFGNKALDQYQAQTKRLLYKRFGFR